MTWPFVHLCYWQVKWLFTCVSDKSSDLAMCLPVFLTSWVTWPFYLVFLTSKVPCYLCFWQVEWFNHVFIVFLTSKVTFYLCFWQVEWLGHVFNCVSDKLSDLAMCLPVFLTSWVTWRAPSSPGPRRTDSSRMPAPAWAAGRARTPSGFSSASGREAGTPAGADLEQKNWE